MAIIHVPRRAYRQPQGRVTVDWGNQLALGLSAALLPGVNRIPVVGNHSVSYAVSGGQFIANSDGIGYGSASSASTGILSFGSSGSPLAPSESASVLVILEPFARSNATSQIISAAHSSTNTNTQRLSQSTTADHRYAAGNTYLTTGIPATFFAGHTYREDGATIRSNACFGDGSGIRQTNSVTWSATYGYQSVTAAPGAGIKSVLAIFVWDGVAVPLAELASLAANPWQLFRESPLRIYSLPPAGTTQDLAASGSATASGSAALRADVGLAGVGVSVAGGAAGAVASVSLAAAGLALFSGSAGLEAGATVTLTAAGLAQAAGAAGLAADVLLAGAGAAEAAGSAGLAAELRALAAGGAVAGGSATLSGGAAGEIGAVGGVDAGGAAGLLITVSLAGLGGAVAGGSAALETGAGGDLGAAGGAVAAGGGVLSATVALTAAGFVQAMGAGALAVQFPLSAFGAGSAGGSAVLSDAGGLVLIASPRWRVPATNRRWEVVL